MTNEYDPRHSHEPEIAPVIAPDGHCRICRMIVNHDKAVAALERLTKPLHSPATEEATLYAIEVEQIAQAALDEIR